MHVLREILREKLGLGRSHRKVAASVGVSAPAGPACGRTLFGCLLAFALAAALSS